MPQHLIESLQQIFITFILNNNESSLNINVFRQRPTANEVKNTTKEQ